ncbi:RNA polymerase sigma-70 factor [Tenacibaculum sp. ZH3_bin.2]|uniref:RNA polymerase sigma-70 factor n=1 Tax=Tenacibaculum sp. ZH3_bin.2 TaxID=3155931 RepID=UPI0036EE59FE
MKRIKTYRLTKEKSFEKLYRTHWKSLYLLCYSKTNSKEAAEEIVQDVFISLWKRVDKIEFTNQTQNYLLKSARNKIVDYYRSKNSYKNKKKLEEITSDCVLKETKSIEHNLAVTNFLENDLQLVVNRLPNRCQEVYRLSREQQLSTAEIAIQLEISPKTVKNHLTKALAFIHENLKII